MEKVCTASHLCFSKISLIFILTNYSFEFSLSMHIDWRKMEIWGKFNADKLKHSLDIENLEYPVPDTTAFPPIRKVTFTIIRFLSTCVDPDIFPTMITEIKQF